MDTLVQDFVSCLGFSNGHWPGAVFAEIDRVMVAMPVAQLLAWQWRILEARLPVCDIDSKPTQQLVTRREIIPEWYSQLTNRIDQLLDPIAPPTLSRAVPALQTDDGLVLWILHLYSGRRRHADLHDWLVHWSSLLSQVKSRILSMDAAVCPNRGNLSDGPNFDLLLSIVAKGLFCAVISGPPCETWRAARHVVATVEDGRPMPRPLRAADPWGILERSHRELVQVGVGRKLIRCYTHGKWKASQYAMERWP